MIPTATNLRLLHRLSADYVAWHIRRALFNRREEVANEDDDAIVADEVCERIAHKRTDSGYGSYL